MQRMLFLARWLHGTSEKLPKRLQREAARVASMAAKRKVPEMDFIYLREGDEWWPHVSPSVYWPS
eukprot:422138-Lingulodinium_polyedra.AAC.1